MRSSEFPLRLMIFEFKRQIVPIRKMQSRRIDVTPFSHIALKMALGEPITVFKLSRLRVLLGSNQPDVTMRSTNKAAKV